MRSTHHHGGRDASSRKRQHRSVPLYPTNRSCLARCQDDWLCQHGHLGVTAVIAPGTTATARRKSGGRGKAMPAGHGEGNTHPNGKDVASRRHAAPPAHGWPGNRGGHNPKPPRQVGAAGARPNRAKTKKEKMHGGGRGAPKERSGSSPQRTWLSAAAGHRGATPVPAASGPPLAARRSPTGRSPTCVSPRRRDGPPLWRCRHHARAAAGRTAAIGRHGRRGRRGRR